MPNLAFVGNLLASYKCYLKEKPIFHNIFFCASPTTFMANSKSCFTRQSGIPYRHTKSREKLSLVLIVRNKMCKRIHSTMPPIKIVNKMY